MGSGPTGLVGRGLTWGDGTGFDWGSRERNGSGRLVGVGVAGGGQMSRGRLDEAGVETGGLVGVGEARDG